MIYCVLPARLSHLHDELRAHFAQDEDIDVVVERRARDRRRSAERRAGETEPEVERRAIRSVSGRRIADRRDANEISAALPLPPAVEGHRGELVFVERDAPSDLRMEDIDTARLVMRWQSGDRAAFTDLYMRYFDRVYGYVRLILVDTHEAEDVTQEAFIAVFDALSHFEYRGAPFRSWLFASVRNRALDRLRRRDRLSVADHETLVRTLADEQAEPDPSAAFAGLSSIGDRRLLALLEKLPETQRQLVVLRYLLDLDNAEIAQITGRTPEAVRQLHQRAMTFLRRHLADAGDLTA